MWGLTFELSGRRRQDARPGLEKMYRVPPDRAWWPAVGAPLERGVRRQCQLAGKATEATYKIGFVIPRFGAELIFLTKLTNEAINGREASS